MVLASLLVVLAGCSGSATSSTPNAEHPSPAEVIVHLKVGTSASQASKLPSRLLDLGGNITGTDWNAQSPDILRVYLASSETVAEIDRLLPAIRKTSHVAGATVEFG
jgi:hypothetical protein